MNELKIIGHRGVRNISTENTVAAIDQALKAGVEAIELDLRGTSDGYIVSCHNRSLKKVYGIDKYVDQLKLSELKDLRSPHGDQIPTLKEILEHKTDVPYMLDVKATAPIEEIIKVTKQYPKATYFISTFYWEKAKKMKRLDPSVKVSLATFKRPLKAIKAARRIKADFITIPVYLLNPLTYHKARKAGLRPIIYMNYLPFLLTTPIMVNTLLRLYPEVVVCTDRPDKIIPALKS